MTNDDITFRKPVAEDGAAIWELVRACKPLDENSMYCNVIQCDHFADTCMVAELDGDVLGWISAYIRPDDDATLFVWQVAVSERARGRGLAGDMLQHLLDREACVTIMQLQTTITRDNEASWALFGRFADAQGGSLADEPHFERDEHFDGAHATEHMVTICLSKSDVQRAA